MRRLGLLLLCVFGLAGCAASPPRAGPAADALAEQAQILVMLRAAPPHFSPIDGYAGSYLSAPDREAHRRTARRLAREHGLTLVSDWPMPDLGVDCFVMQTRRREQVASTVQALAADPRVESAQPMHLFRVLGQGDPLYALQPAARQWHLSELHALTTGRGQLIAELDSGVELDHPDLRGQVAQARNFVGDGEYRAEAHGTAVAGLMVAKAGNGLGIAGIAPEARLLALRACWQMQPDDPAAVCSSFTLAKALQYALQNRVQIVNLSLAGPSDRLLERLLDVAMARQVTVVGALDEAAADGGFPADYPGVLAVAGEHVASDLPGLLRAPGEELPTTTMGQGFGFVSGSSYAAAQVSGLVALLRELTPAIRPSELHTALSTGTALGLPMSRSVMIDACAAVARASGRCACDCRAASAAWPALQP
jgi:hypothetical protein